MDIFWPEMIEPVALAGDEAHVFAVPVDQVLDSGRDWPAILSADERERAERYKLHKPRRQFVAGRAGLRMLLGQYLDVPAAAISFGSNAHGKPCLAASNTDADLRFNVAHAEELVLVAMAVGCEVGVDVERMRTVNHLEQIAHRYFHAGEVQEILAKSAAERAAAFLRCWTGKEAIVKAKGEGLNESLSNFRVPIDCHRGDWIEVAPETAGGSVTRSWLQSIEPCSDYVAAVALLGERRRLRCFAFPSKMSRPA